MKKSFYKEYSTSIIETILIHINNDKPQNTILSFNSRISQVWKKSETDWKYILAQNEKWP